MINATNMGGAHTALYGRADLLFPSLEAAWAAIDALRAGDPARQRLGDWSPILPEFDPFRDEKSADRLRAVVENAVLRDGGAPSVGLR
jgi:hypothetical protein